MSLHYVNISFKGILSLQEMFAITVQHVNKTWREMRATSEDFHKVMDVAREQVGFKNLGILCPAL